MTRSSHIPQPSRQPGQALTEFVHEEMLPWWYYLFGATTALVVVAAVSWAHVALGRSLSPVTTSALALFFIAWSAWTIRNDWPAIRNKLLGAKGERAVADVLADLRQHGYRVVHDLQAQSPDGANHNVDHVLIGPAGVFAVETKARTRSDGRKPRVVYNGKTITVDGCAPDRDPIAQANGSAATVRQIIRAATGRDQWVMAVILYVGCTVSEKSGAKPWVLSPQRLERWLATEERFATEDGRFLASDDIQRFTIALQAATSAA